MPERKPSAFLASLIAASGLAMAALGRRGVPEEPARSRARPGRAERRAGRGDDRAGDRGQGATHPSEIPARGWWDILKRTAGQFSEDRVMTEAAGVTFYTLLALFPAVAALVSLYGLFAEPATITEHLSALSNVVPGGGMQIIEEQVKRIAAKGGGALGFGAALGILTSLWSANQAAKAVVDSLNIVYGEKERRGFVAKTLTTLALTLGGLLLVLLAITGVVAVPVALNLVGLGSGVETLLSLARWPVLLLAVALFLAILYRFGPSRDRAQWRWVSWGSGIASLVWLGFCLGFSFYVSRFGNYNETYGSLGAVVGFMTWIWLSATVVLMGAELDAEMEHQTARDTTTGPERPLGARGARMADTVAG